MSTAVYFFAGSYQILVRVNQTPCLVREVGILARQVAVAAAVRCLPAGHL